MFVSQKAYCNTMIRDSPTFFFLRRRHDIIAYMKYVTITKGWDGCPVAYQLSLEGADSIIGQIQDVAELRNGDDKEDPKDRKQRLSQYDGMIRKYPARKVIEALAKVKNKDDYFIYFDQNNLWFYSEYLLRAGFTKGLFPLKKDYEFEKDRDAAMKFVKDNYAEVKIIPHQVAKTVEEAKKMVEESEVPLVIQSMGDFVSTICPEDDLENNRAQILAALDKNAKDYAKGSILLKEKLIQPVEITPQIVFWNGNPVFTDIDIETKNIGDGENNGNQVGCGSNLIVSTGFDEKINRIAFPPKVHEMAKERKGLFVWDISLYFTEKGIFFGEFCSNRFGYDAIMTECSMSGGASAYFDAIMKGENPLKSKFGAAMRVFNLNRSEDVEIIIGKPECTYLYEVKKKGDQLVSVGDCWDLGVIAGCGETVEESVEEAYGNLKQLSFKEKYSRTKDDFLSDYPTSIIRRYQAVNGVYFEAPEFSFSEKSSDSYGERIKMERKSIEDDHMKKLEDMREIHKREIQGIRSEIQSILS